MTTTSRRSTEELNQIAAGSADSLQLDQLRSLRDELLAEMRSFLDSVQADRPGDSNLSVSESRRFDAYQKAAERVSNKVEQYQRMMDAFEAHERGEPTPGFRILEPHGTGRSATGANRPWERIDTSGREAMMGLARSAIELDTYTPDAGKEHATRLLERAAGTVEGHAIAEYIAVTSDPAYLRAFAKMVADPARGRDTWTEAERTAARRVLERASSLTGSAGGYAVPFTLDPTVILTNDGTANPIRQIARVVQTTTDQWAGVSSAGVTASWAAEATEATDDAPTLAQPEIKVHKAHAFCPFSIEVGQDWQGLAEELRRLILDAKDRLEAAAFIKGLGDSSNQPWGLVTRLEGTASEVDPTTPETFQAADVYKLGQAVPDRYWPQARWLAHRSTGFTIRQFATGAAQDAGSFWSDLNGDTPPLLLGRPFHECSDLDASTDVNAAVTADNFLMVAGDFSRYVIADRIGMTVELIPHLFSTANNRPTGQRGFYAFWRVGADVVDANGLRVLNVATSA